MDLFSSFFQSTFNPIELPATCLQTHDAIIKAPPASYAHINAVSVNHNLAVIPDDWKSSSITTEFFNIDATEPCVTQALSQIKTADFIAFDESFYTVLGPHAKVEKIQSFAKDEQNVHEAPIYLPETNELLYSDTSIAGHMYAIDIDTHQVRKFATIPPLNNVNGGTYHAGQIYVAENGGSVRGIFAVNITTGAATPLVNNFRGRHFNSPNDLIFDSATPYPNIYFTDPPYGHESKWRGVQVPELPFSIYKFNTGTKSTVALSNSILGYPNGLAFSPNEKVLYVADSSSTSLGIGSQRAVFAFDVRPGGLLDGPRLVHQLESGWADGLRVTKRGLLVVAVAGGADFVDPKTGVLLGRINTPDDTIFNLEPARGKGVWLLTGRKHIYKATIQEAPVDRPLEKVAPFLHQLSRLLQIRKG